MNGPFACIGDAQIEAIEQLAENFESTTKKSIKTVPQTRVPVIKTAPPRVPVQSTTVQGQVPPPRVP
eukprot:1800181-Ditylum_brightwellii.AAC.1